MIRTFRAYVVFCFLLGAANLALNLALYFHDQHRMFNLVFGIVAFFFFAVGIPLIFRKIFPGQTKPGPIWRSR